ncbi:MAG TPA: hypothetical protein VM599_11605, partial [Thermoanaerobaculia bacterium]|nr:hypothetical protein [Thermoanaerobaculia bacterium]
MSRLTARLMTGLGLLTIPGLAGAVPLDPGHAFTSAPALAALPDGGFVAVWVRERQEISLGGSFCTPERLVGARLDDDGSPAAAPQAIELPEGDLVGNPRMAATDGGATALSWQGPGGLRVGALRDDFAVASASLLTSCPVRSHALVAAGDGFWAAWSESCAGLRVRAQRLDREARPVGPIVEVADPFGQPGASVALAGRPDGGFSAAWIESVAAIGRRVLGGRFRADGSLVGAVFPVSPGASSAGLSLAAATLSDGRMAFAWKDGDGRLLWRRFTPTPAPSGPIVQAAELAAPREEAPRFAVGP